MTIQYGTTCRNAKLDAINTHGTTTAKMRIYSGAQPANCAAARSGTVLSTTTLPSDWMNAASGGTKTKLGTWTDASADADG